jgi:V/A-type H+-transporting ATPase subunit D
MILGEKKVEDVSNLIMDIGEVSFATNNIMGVKIPKMDIGSLNTKSKRIYGLFETCSKLDDSQKKFQDIVIKLVELADLEGSIKSLAVEIEKTKRRVNVLENTLIPKLRSTRKYIEMQLEEREREDFVRRKRIKDIMENKKRQNAFN